MCWHYKDWCVYGLGLEKDILLPFKEQTGPVREGREYLVRMYADKSERLCVSMKVYDYLRCDSPYKQGDEISGIVIEYSPEYGAFVAVDDKYSALIPKKELHSTIYAGDRIHGRVAAVRDDGKLNLTLQKPIKMQIRRTQIWYTISYSHMMACFHIMTRWMRVSLRKNLE